jgi:hypothetical protein
MLDRIGGTRSAFSPTGICGKEAFMEHENVAIVDTWVVERIECLEHGFICGLTLNQANIPRRGAKRKKPLNRWAGVREWIVRPSFRRFDSTTQGCRVQLTVNHFAPQVLKQFGLGSH